VENKFAGIGVELHTVKHVSNERLGRFINQIGPKLKPPLHICAEKPINLLPKIFLVNALLGRGDIAAQRSTTGLLFSSNSRYLFSLCSALF